MGYRVVSPDEVNTNQNGLGISYNGGDARVFKPLNLTNKQALENLKNLLKPEVEDIITEPINFWLPYIDIENIEIITAEDDPSLPHNIKITITFSVGSFESEDITISANENGTIEVGESNG